MILPMAVVAVGVIAYANSFSGVFLMDDYSSIVKNPDIGDLGRMVRSSTRPLTKATFHLNYRIHGIAVPGYHLVNLAIHLTAGLLLFGLVRTTLSFTGRSADPGLRAQLLAFGVAGIWLAHPLQTQSVTYIVQRAESLMGMFYLLTLYCAARAMMQDTRSKIQDPATKRAEPSCALHLASCIPWSVLSVAACALGMLSKPVMVTAPAAVLLYDRAYASGSLREALRLRRWLHAGLASTWIVLAVLLTAPHESSHSAGIAAEGLPSAGSYLLTQAEVVLHYLRTAFIPTAVCFDYAWPPVESWREAWLPAVIVLLLLFVSLWAFVRNIGPGFPALFFFLALAPSSSIIPVADCAFDHRMYLPLAGLAAVAVFTLDRLCVRLAGASGAVRSGYGIAVSCLVMGVLVAATIDRNRDYHSRERMWSDVLSKRPGNLRAHETLIDLKVSRGDLNGAEDAAGRLLRAVESLEGTLDGRSFAYHYTAALDRMGRILAGRGRFGTAIQYYRRAIAVNPANKVARCNLAVAQILDGAPGEALETCEETLQTAPTYAKAHAMKGLALRKLGRYVESIASYEAALRHDDGVLYARYDLAWLLAACPETGLCDGERAVVLAREVCAATDGRSVEGLDLLAAAYARAGRFAEAVEAAQRALDIAGPDSAASGDLRKRLDLYRAGRAFTTATN